MDSSMLALGIAVAAVFVTVLLLVPARLVRGVALAMAFIIAAFVANLRVDPNLNLAGMVFGILLLSISLIRVRSTPAGERLLQGTLALWWVLAFLSSVIMKGYGFVGILIFGTFALLMSHVALHLDRDAVRLFVRSVLVLMALEVVLAAVETATGMAPLWGREGSRENPFLGNTVERAQASFGHPIVFGWFMAVCMVLVWINAARLKRSLYLVAFVVAGAGLALSGTRSAVLSALVGIGLHIVMRPGLSTWLRNLLATAGAAFVILAMGVGNSISSLAADLVDSGSWIQRLGNITSMPALLGRPPLESFFGTGWGRDARLFVEGYLYSPYRLYVVDNMFVEALGTLGILGLATLIAMIVVAMVRGDRGSRAITATITAMMFSFDTMVWPFTAIALMTFFSLTRLNKNEPKETPEPSTELAVETSPSTSVGARRLHR